MQQKKIFNFVWKAGVSAAFLWWLVVKIDWREVWENMQKIKPAALAFYVLVLLLGMSISAAKWRFLAKSRGFTEPWREFFALYFTGAFLNNFMPSFIGGDTYRSYQLGKSTKQYARAASTVVIDRITGLMGAMLLALMFAAFNYRSVGAHPVLVVLLVGIVAGLGTLFLLEKSSKYSWGKKLFSFIPAKILSFLKILHEYYLDKGLFLRALLWATLFGLVGLGALNFVIFWALGIKIAVLDYLSVIFLISIVSAAPVSINNIGVQEWAYVTFFGFFGVSAAEVITVSILIRLLQMLVSFFALPLYLRRKQ